MSAFIFEQYLDYRDSEDKWLGTVPKHWKVYRLKELASIQNSNVDKKSYATEIPIRLCNYVDVYNKNFISELLSKTFMWATANELERRKFGLRSGDVLITKDSESSDDIAIPALVTATLSDVLCGYHLAQIRPNAKYILGAYLLYLFKSTSYASRFVVMAKGITRVGLGQAAIADAMTPIPTLPEQVTISSYLDKKTTQIDKKIELLRKKKAQYDQLKKSLIDETVFRGLDKMAPLKDSGVKWIGRIPSHWVVKRVSDVARQNKTKNRGLIDTNLLSLSYGRIIRKDLNASFGLLPESFETYQVLNRGTIVLRLTDLQNDQRSLRVGLAKERGIITSAYLGLIFHRSINPSFAYYFLHVYDLRKVFYWFGGGLRSTMRFDDIRVIPFFTPPRDEQERIVTYLDEKTTQIDNIITSINQQIENLTELRITLINDVVIGKIKVAMRT